jgi:Domain of unknown function (DUF4270)
MDSLRTTSLSGELNRMLVGSYVDPALGSISAGAYSQFRPTDVTTILDTDAEFDSAVLQLRYDFYSYGAPGETVQNFSVHEITEELNFEEDYYFNSDIDTEINSIGTAQKSIDANTFKTELEDTDADAVVTTRIKLDNSFGQRLFSAINPNDTLYTNFLYFKEQFKGLAILPSQSDKVVGFGNLDTNTYLRVYYHSGSTTKSITFVMASCVTFSKIDADRSATELAGLNSFSTDFTSATSRYIQSGSSVVTKLDLSKFYDYMDTIPEMIINSAELNISGVDPSIDFEPGKLVSINMLSSNNRYNTLDTRQDTLDFISFNGSLAISDLSKQFIADDQGKVFSMPYSSINNSYSGYPTVFFQKLYDLRDKRYPYWSIVNNDPPMGKAVNRSVFPKDNIKLKVYYTRSTLNENP